MLEKGLVSIITPCYNGEKHIFRLLDSILTQTYPFIQMIIIDDGSIDDTKSIISSYIPRFESRNYTLSYVYQENSGQAAAINRALTLYTGEYLVWPDSDDYYNSAESITKMVNALQEEREEVSIVKVYTNEIEETTGNIKKKYIHNNNTNWFYDCLLENNFAVLAGANMIRSAILRKELENNSIYQSRFGQNWQILLPILYSYKGVTIPDFLFTIVSREL